MKWSSYNLFFCFRKSSPENIYREISSKIIISSLSFGQEIDEINNKLSSDACAEFVYFLAHIVLRLVSELYDVKKAKQIYEEISKRTIIDYCNAVLAVDTPDYITEGLKDQMFKDIKSRQMLYSKCKTITDHFQSKETMIFALSFLINKALKRTSRNDILEIITGQKEINKSDLKDLPSFCECTKVSIYAGIAINSLNLKKFMKKLK